MGGAKGLPEAADDLDLFEAECTVCRGAGDRCGDESVGARTRCSPCSIAQRLGGATSARPTPRPRAGMLDVPSFQIRHSIRRAAFGIGPDVQFGEADERAVVLCDEDAQVASSVVPRRSARLRQRGFRCSSGQSACAHLDPSSGASSAATCRIADGHRCSGPTKPKAQARSLEPEACYS